jgi:hypothetical protein
MTQLNLLDETQLPLELSDAIAWATKRESKLIIAIKMCGQVWLEEENMSAVAWLKNVGVVTGHGRCGDNYAIELGDRPSWLDDEMRKYKSPLGGSSHPVNEVEWV